MTSVRTGNTQYGALPYRVSGDGLQILLITSRDSGRWIIPKGWPIAGLSPSNSAAREALEEAGVTGNISTDSIGTYSYDKRLANDATRSCDVAVFALEVTEQHDTWPEQHQRRREWLGVEEAGQRISEAEVRPLMEKLREQLATRKSQR
ncbi:NUDIX hydrolase [Rhodoplanes sp. Z2-YC6860]|uniref:NUDIX hydrolase n=1 Tax=Rhodoplanes sp. Z2-YC6860 TaxID=674703 RepID=UPI00078CAE52|nr:NUDIX hydrolase [Rhodoplanes sp. Z2-YC6860]AMN39324.1 NTP pyrophosphohydrolase [Rhodoplanes sp. Z2-YC6860]